MKSLRGFTLVELVVVIGIIGVLATVVYASFGGAREQARNTSLMSELKEVQLALELYRSQNGMYPEANTECDQATTINSESVTISRTTSCNTAPYIAALVPEFIAELPMRNDSSNSNCDIVYTVNDSQSSYKLAATRCFMGATNAATGINQDSEFARCPSSCGATCSGVSVTAEGFYESMAVYSGGGACY